LLICASLSLWMSSQFVVDSHQPDRIAALVYQGTVRSKTYVFVISVEPGAAGLPIVRGDRRSGRRTKVGGHDAYGMLQPWDLPIRRLTTFALTVDGNPVEMPTSDWADIFNVRLAPLKGPTPPAGTLDVSVESGSGYLRIDLMPAFLDSSTAQQTNTEIKWRISPSGQVQREVSDWGSHVILNRIGEPIDSEVTDTTPLAYIAIRRR
jgi:hypothetical protein